MIAIEVVLLTGRYVATAHHDRREHEWPPHPARVFSALVATWADAAEPDAEQRKALEWLERQDPPEIAASRDDDVAVRRAVSHFVPVNDASVVAGAQYRTRARRLAEFVDQYEDEAESSGNTLTRSAERLRDKIDKERAVDSLVTTAGKTNPTAAAQMLPDGRTKQERHFPSVTPADSRVVYRWDADLDASSRAALGELLAGVTRIGHSSSLVSCRLTEEVLEPTLQPGAGTRMLRCTQRGQLAALEQMHAGHASIRPRSLPFVGVPYSEAEDGHDHDGVAIRPDLAGDLVVFELPAEARRMPVTRVVEFTQAMRGAIFRHAADPLPEGLSGHTPDGAPSRDPHAVFLGLPFVGHPHADGRLIGLAMMLPAGMSDDARHAALRAVGHWEESTGPRGLCMLMLPGGRTFDLMRKQPPFELSTLRTATWSRPSSEWISATPIALPKNPGRLTSGSPAARARAWAAAEEEVRQSCIHVGLPEPAAVAVSLDPLIPGGRPAGHYPAFVQGTRRGDGVRRRLVHAAVRFDEDISGPLVLGSGRFLGLGLMRPVLRQHSLTRDGDPQVGHER
ncbi:type I-U CRISPR-associated protein Csb2 [Candidatus Poriferisodalis sp.]|uniref:type I-G CRISPR-associated protein Csb2 n=1 Tax=Candidatus Poriferisodalis sp. TaxID=3101277 RepID=UPI003B021A09